MMFGFSWRRARVAQFRGWPPPPPDIVPMSPPRDPYPDPRWIAWGVLLGVVALVVILLADYLL
jgi:hypothetical protein